jgi:uncharacterized protein YeaO (DUF488 family)
MLTAVRTKRVWDPFSPDDGARFLVDPRWPPGVQHDSLRIVLWIREVAPSPSLQKWFKQNRSDWDGFRERYRDELMAMADWEPLVRQARLGPVTLIYAARDRIHNHAVVLADFITERAAV